LEELTASVFRIEEFSFLKLEAAGSSKMLVPITLQRTAVSYYSPVTKVNFQIMLFLLQTEKIF
jgi:hypothetical protein